MFKRITYSSVSWLLFKCKMNSAGFTNLKMFIANMTFNNFLLTIGKVFVKKLIKSISELDWRVTSYMLSPLFIFYCWLTERTYFQNNLSLWYQNKCSTWFVLEMCSDMEKTWMLPIIFNLYTLNIHFIILFQILFIKFKLKWLKVNFF